MRFIIVFVAAMAVMLVGATALETEDAFAGKRNMKKIKQSAKQTPVETVNYH